MVWREGLTPTLSPTGGGTAAGTFRFSAMIVRLKRLPPLALCALAAMTSGLLGGATAVHGLRQNSYGPLDPPSLISRNTESGYAEGTSSYDGYGDRDAAGCGGCSERDLGYRWATLAAIRSSTECPNDSWGFRRGCLDYTGGV